MPDDRPTTTPASATDPLTVKLVLAHGEYEPILRRAGRTVEWSGRFFGRRRDALAFVRTWPAADGAVVEPANAR